MEEDYEETDEEEDDGCGVWRLLPLEVHDAILTQLGPREAARAKPSLLATPSPLAVRPPLPAATARSFRELWSLSAGTPLLLLVDPDAFIARITSEPRRRKPVERFEAASCTGMTRDLRKKELERKNPKLKRKRPRGPRSWPWKSSAALLSRTTCPSTRPTFCGASSAGARPRPSRGATGRSCTAASLRRPTFGPGATGAGPRGRSRSGRR